MKLYLEPVKVELAPDGTPLQIIWRQQVYRIRGVQEQWLYHGRWWLTPQLQGRCRHYYRVTAISQSGPGASKASRPRVAPTVAMEMFEEAGQWMLSRLLD